MTTPGTSEWHARRTAGRARRFNIPRVRVVQRGIGEYVVTVPTPFHDRPVILRDLLDVDYLAAELARHRVQPARQHLETA